MNLKTDSVFTRIDRNMSDLIGETARYFAGLYLAEFRKRLEPHNLKNHKISITAAMGYMSIDINGTALVEYTCSHWKEPEVIKLLNSLQNVLNWDWAYHLHGECLN